MPTSYLTSVHVEIRVSFFPNGDLHGISFSLSLLRLPLYLFIIATLKYHHEHSNIILGQRYISKVLRRDWTPVVPLLLMSQIKLTNTDRTT